MPEDWPLRNVWLGVTAENQEMANKRLPILLSDFPAEKRFVSVEPMVGPVDLGNALGCPRKLGGINEGSYLDWVIVGGETGPNSRQMNPNWALKIKQDCEYTKTPFFMKQMTNKAPIPDFLKGREFPHVR